MARTVSNQVAHRNAAAVKATAALEARRTAHDVVVDLEIRTDAAGDAWKAAVSDENTDADDQDAGDWLEAMLAGSPSDDLYDAFEALNTELIAARDAHVATVTAHDAADAHLAHAQDMIIRDRSARFRQLCRSGARDDYGHE